MGRRRRKNRPRHRAGRNYRHKLAILCQRQGRPEPRYEVVPIETVDVDGPQVTVALYLGDKKVSEGTGKSQNKAEQYAARDALGKVSRRAVKGKDNKPTEN